MSKVTIQNLVSTMNSTVPELFKKMNLKNDAIFVNQTDEHSFKEHTIDQHCVEEYSFKEKGVGLSRNSALHRATADLCMVSDDDMVYVDNYLEIVGKAYAKYPDADMILFNIRIHDKEGVSEKSSYSGKIHYLNSLKYGTATFTFKREPVEKHRLSFSLLFGGGAKYSNGEDNLFLWDCLKAGMKVYAYGEVIADVYNDESSWFTGYNEKFFRDRGALFQALTANYSWFLILQYIVRRKSDYEENFTAAEIFSFMKQGKREYKTNQHLAFEKNKI